MIPKVTIGKSADGLVKYLLGDGRANEHSDQHIISCSSFGQVFEDEKSAADWLKLPAVGRITEQKDYIMHISLSIKSDDGVLSDFEWQEIAQKFTDKLQFNNFDATEQFRWLAVRHGVSSNGNDHIHLAVNIYNMNADRWRTHNNAERAQQACRELERKLPYLVALPGYKYDRSTVGYTQAEFKKFAEVQARQKYERNWTEGEPHFDELELAEQNKLIKQIDPRELPRRTLEQLVRGAATASQTEDEFVRRLRKSGVLLNPRFNYDCSEVTGYSVALKTIQNANGSRDKPVWYGGGKLAHDLTITRLRHLWREDDGKAVDEWIAAQKHKKPVYVGAEASEYSERQIQQLQERLESLQQQLRLLGQDNRQWIKVARYTAGCFANYAERLLSERRKQFLDLAQELRIAAQTKHYSAELAGAKSPIHSSVVAPKHQQISTNALRSAARLLKQIKSKTGQQKKIMSTVAGVARLCLKNRASQERVKMKADLLQQLEQLQISQQTSQDKHLPVAQQKATSQTL